MTIGNSVAYLTDKDHLALKIKHMLKGVHFRCSIMSKIHKIDHSLKAYFLLQWSRIVVTFDHWEKKLKLTHPYTSRDWAIRTTDTIT